MINYIQLQTCFFFFIVTVLPAFQLILPAAHGHKPQICLPENPIEIIHLYISFQFDFLLAAQRSICSIRKSLQPHIFLLSLFHNLPPSNDCIINIPVIFSGCILSIPFSGKFLLLFLCQRKRFQNTSFLQTFAFRQLAFQRLLCLNQSCQQLFLPLIPLSAHLPCRLQLCLFLCPQSDSRFQRLLRLSCRFSLQVKNSLLVSLKLSSLFCHLLFTAMDHRLCFFPILLCLLPALLQSFSSFLPDAVFLKLCHNLTPLFLQNR